MAFHLVGSRLEADQTISGREFEEIAQRLAKPPLRARKIGCVAARRASQYERIETRWNGHETHNTAAIGDWIVTALSVDQSPLQDREGKLNTYVISAERFAELYEPTSIVLAWGTVFRPKGIVQALRLEDGFDILAPWGERQCCDDGYLVLNGAEVYGNNAETFGATYEILGNA